MIVHAAPQARHPTCLRDSSSVVLRGVGTAPVVLLHVKRVLWAQQGSNLRPLACKFRVPPFTVVRRRLARWTSHLSHVDVLSRTAMNETKTETMRPGQSTARHEPL